MSVSVKTSHLAPARFSKISFGLTETHPRDCLWTADFLVVRVNIGRVVRRKGHGWGLVYMWPQIHRPALLTRTIVGEVPYPLLFFKLESGDVS